MTKRWALLVTALLALGLSGGCQDKDDVDRRRLLASVSGLMTAWAREDPALLERYISEDYAFDEQSKADHIAAIAADFPDLRDFRLARQQLEIISPNLASVQVEFSAQLLADVAALDHPTPILAWAPSVNALDQVWIKDFDGVWRLAAEYLQRSWVVDDTPVIGSFSVSPGDQIRPGDTGAFTAVASAASNSHRVALWPGCDAAQSFSPDFAFGFGVATYDGDITMRSDAFGEYSFAVIGQTDIPGSPRMLGRMLRAVYIVVSDRAGRAIIGGKTVPGNTQSVFRRMRIHRAAGRYREPRPGAAP
ncbi:MAG TPA: hypothetical protein VM221_04305 [Armatimonadota bacterium]|nr:hypothetical protein [Armatimonadota bacterium]